MLWNYIIKVFTAFLFKLVDGPTDAIAYAFLNLASKGKDLCTISRVYCCLMVMIIVEGKLYYGVELSPKIKPAVVVDLVPCQMAAYNVARIL